MAESKRKEAESKCNEEHASERLIDAEEDVSKWKRLATKAPKFDSALVEELRAKLKHSEELFGEERRKFKEHAAHELRKTQEELKNANEQLDAARTSTASIESLLPSKLQAVIGALLLGHPCGHPVR